MAAPRVRKPVMPGAAGSGSLWSGVATVASTLIEQHKTRKEEKEKLEEIEAQTALTRAANELKLDPFATGDDVAQAYRAIGDEKIEAIRQDNPELASRLALWWEKQMATPIEQARKRDSENAREQAQNTFAESIDQAENAIEEAVKQAFAGETTELMQQGAANLDDHRAHIEGLLSQADPSLAAAYSANLEPHLAQLSMDALRTEFRRQGRSDELMAMMRRGDLRDFTVPMDETAVSKWMDDVGKDMAADARAETARSEAITSATKEMRKAAAEAAVRELMSGKSQDEVRRTFFKAGGQATGTHGWKSVLNDYESIKDDEEAAAQAGWYASDFVRGNEAQMEEAIAEIATEQDAVALESKMQQLRKAKAISPDFATFAEGQIKLERDAVKLSNAEFEDAFKESFSDPLKAMVPESTASGMGAALTEDQIAFKGYVARITRIFKKMAARDGFDMEEGAAWRQLAVGFWQRSQSLHGMQPPDKDQATAWLENAISKVRREGYARDATDEELMGVIDATQPDIARMAQGVEGQPRPGSTRTYAHFDNGVLNMEQTSLNIADLAPGGQKHLIYLDMVSEYNIAQRLRGLQQMRTAAEELKEFEASEALATALPESTIVEEEIAEAAAEGRTPTIGGEAAAAGRAIGRGAAHVGRGAAANLREAARNLGMTGRTTPRVGGPAQRAQR